MSFNLVLLRHGESTWNLENRFTGWTDVGLSPRGVEEARAAGGLLREEGLEFDATCSSVLTRAILTLQIALEAFDRVWLPVERSWRLNERHYGALQGLNKKEMTEKYGEKQVFEWRRSYATPPPPLSPDDPRHASHDPRYASLAPDLVPASESLKNVVARVLPYWHDRIVPWLVEGRRVLVAAHGNSLRALVKHLDGVSDDDISQLNIPTGIPLAYEIGRDCRPVSHRYLGDPQAAARAAEAVARQATASR